MGWFWSSGQGAEGMSRTKDAVPAGKPELRLTVHFGDGDKGEFQIPACGHVGARGLPFQWNIDWGDGVYERVLGTSSGKGGDVSEGSLVHKFAVPGSYEIILSPIGGVVDTAGDTPGWLQAFGYPETWMYFADEGGSFTEVSFPKGGDRLVGVGGVLDDRAINIELEDACAAMFAYCENITMGRDFTISSRKERAGDSFCRKMFEGCGGDAFTMGESFQLPRNLRTVGDSFCRDMFRGVGPSFTMNDTFTIPQQINSTGSFFCSGMFLYHGPALSMGKSFNLPQDITKAESYFCASMFSSSGAGDQRFEMNDLFNLPQHISGQVGNGFCSSMFQGNRSAEFCMNSRFNIPPGITSSGDAFCAQMFQGCSGAGFSMNSVFNIPACFGLTGAECCARMFSECRGAGFRINEEFTLPADLRGGEWLAFKMFDGCDWSALNWNMREIINCNPNLGIWSPAFHEWFQWTSL